MPIRVAIPMPHSTNHEYGQRAIPQYERAVVLAGAARPPNMLAGFVTRPIAC